jgi:hypothetical protein
MTVTISVCEVFASHYQWQHSCYIYVGDEGGGFEFWSRGQLDLDVSWFYRVPPGKCI